jgi:FSR family fosmidomycin resistance protein-like MFS transporter
LWEGHSRVLMLTCSGLACYVFAQGFILASAFSIILVYAQELLPEKVGLVSGLFFGLAFGLGGLSSALLGLIADATSLSFIIKIRSYFPLISIFTLLLPKDNIKRVLEI